MKKQWFLDRLGKVVYRSNNDCLCWLCQVTFRDGVLIKNVDIAEHLYELSCGLQHNYFDSKQERDNFVENGTEPTT